MKEKRVYELRGVGGGRVTQKEVQSTQPPTKGIGKELGKKRSADPTKSRH